MPVSLEITRGSGTGSERRLDRELTIGRDPAADLTLPDGGVSRRHARLRPAAGGAPVIEDLDSSNGTFVNGERVAGERRLADGDEVQIGEAEIAVREAGAPNRRRAAPQPSPPGPGGSFNWAAALAFVLGPLSILLIITGSGGAFYGALPVAIAAIVCGSIGKRIADRREGGGLRGFAVAGQVFGIIGAVVAAVAIVALLILNAALDAGAESLSGLIDQVRAEVEGISLPEDVPAPEGWEGSEPPEGSGAEEPGAPEDAVTE